MKAKQVEVAKIDFDSGNAGVMVLNLERGDSVGLVLRRVRIGLGWHQSAGTLDFDLDTCAFLLDQNKRLPAGDYFVFYNNLKSPEGSVVSSGDDRTGAGSEGDDEILSVDLERVDPRVNEIVVAVSVHDSVASRQSFGQVREAYIRLYDLESDEEVCKYELDEDFSAEAALEFGRLCRHDDSWRFEAIGVGIEGGLEALVAKYTEDQGEGMVISLEKAHSKKCGRSVGDLSTLTLDLRWKTRGERDWLGRLLGGGGGEYDLDVIALMLDAEGRVADWGNKKLMGGDVIFYNNLRHSTGSVIHSGDQLAGGAKSGEGEQIVVRVDDLPQQYHGIVFIVSIYKGQRRGQHFGGLGEACVRAVDEKHGELARFDLGSDPNLHNMCMMVIGEMRRQSTGWGFHATGDAYPSDSFVTILHRLVAP